MSNDSRIESKKTSIKVGELLESIAFDNKSTDPDQNNQKIFKKTFEKESIDRETNYAHLLGLQDHYKHKGKWSFMLMGVLVFMIGFQSYILINVGKGLLDFTKYDWLLPILLVQNLGQIIGLAFIVVKSLFKDIK